MKNTIRLGMVLKLFLILILLGITAKIVLSYQKQAADNNTGIIANKTDFANCLNKNGLIMYGEDTCEYCQLQKKMFGAAFTKINYVNCQFDHKICQSKNIESFPVWEINNKRVAGIKGFADLARMSGCQLPPGVETNN